MCWGWNSIKTFGNKCCVFKLSTAKEFHMHNVWVGELWAFLVGFWVFLVFFWLVGLGFLFNQILPFYCCCHFRAQCHSWYSPLKAMTSLYAFKSSFGKWLITFFGTKKFITVHKKFCEQLRVPPARGTWWSVYWGSIYRSRKGLSRAVLLGWGFFFEVE